VKGTSSCLLLDRMMIFANYLYGGEQSAYCN
jgi:hypothetical protein